MPEPTLSDAAARFAAALKGDSRAWAQAEVSRFVRWYGASRQVGELRGHNVSLYADVLGPATPDASKRADQVRAFLAYLKKEGLTGANLAPHLRLRKGTRHESAGARAGARAVSELTMEGQRALQSELELLLQQRLQVREDIRGAMQDKDFRENAPLDAAKDKQAHVEARIREIEETLKGAVVVERQAAGSRVRVGSRVVVQNLGSGALQDYTIVGSGESSGGQGRISSESPVGKALLDAAEGDEVEVSVPAGVLRFRVERIEG